MGIGMLTAGIILAVMVIPFITAVMRDVFELVPPVLKESAYGARLDHLGSGVERGAALHARSASSAASCWAWAARSARPWRSRS